MFPVPRLSHTRGDLLRTSATLLLLTGGQLVSGTILRWCVPAGLRIFGDKDSTGVKFAGWSSSRGNLAIIATLEVEDETASTRTITADERYTVHTTNSKNERVVTPSRSRPDHYDTFD
jgi:hypothetical protein